MMYKAKNYREIAWNKLSDKWSTMAIITLIYVAITGAYSALPALGMGTYAAIPMQLIGLTVALLLGGPFTFGWAAISLKITEYKAVNIEDLFCGFKNYTRNLVLYLLQTIFIFLWTLLFIIPGIIKAYSYSLGFYILAENPEMPAQQALKRSEELMEGNRWRLFCLQISFIGWFILCVLTLGILTLWIEPYYQTAMAEFYKSVSSDSVGEESHEEIHERA